MQGYTERCKHLGQHSDRALSALLSFLVVYLKPNAALVTRRRIADVACILIGVGISFWVQHQRLKGVPVLPRRPARRVASTGPL
jgi:hypothetical protein